MKLWIARNKCNFVYLFTFKPKYNIILDSWESYYYEKIELDILCFPEVTFENSPQEVELTLCNHIDTINIQDWDPKKQTCVMTNHGVTTDVIFK